MQNKYCIDIIKMIEAAYPTAFACGWDNVGLLAGRHGKKVNRIYIALDATDEVIDTAVKYNVDMLITHHPLIFSPLKRVSDGDFIGNRVVRLLQNDISYYAMHTNYDVLRMSGLAGERLGIHNPEVMEVTYTAEKDEGLGRIGDLKEALSLADCCNLVKSQFSLDVVKVFGVLEAKVSRIGIYPGSGKHAIEAAIEKGAQALVTGDIDHHEGIDAQARGLAIIDAGHYGIEHIFIEDMRAFLTNCDSELIIETAPIKHPFQMV